ncbi:MAG: hypothetical protein ABJH63_18590 [Rhizobiaceae bacterium]
MHELIRSNYSTYTNFSDGSRERHHLRLSGTLLLSILLVLFSTNISSAYSIIVTGITILTGFVFTALFSNATLAEVGLPPAKDETDRHDLKKLGSLAQNFKARSRYFITLSILDTVIMVFTGLQFSAPKWVGKKLIEVAVYVQSQTGVSLVGYVEAASSVFSASFGIIIIFIFLECLYTFYRLTETVISLIDTRRDYMKAAEDRHNH